MPWNYDARTQVYCLVRGSYRCTVRRMATAPWLAVISHAGPGADASIPRRGPPPGVTPV